MRDGKASWTFLEHFIPCKWQYNYEKSSSTKGTGVTWKVRDKPPVQKHSSIETQSHVEKTYVRALTLTRPLPPPLLFSASQCQVFWYWGRFSH